jgi:LPXTG-motif cell wall-anchored protein
LTIYKDVPEVTEDATTFTFVVTEVVYNESASTFFVNEYIPFSTTVAVSENSPYTIYGLPDGEYQVEELTPPAYYTISGSAIQNVYIGDNGYNQSVTFTNNYYVPPTTTTTTRRTRTVTEVVVPEPIPAGPVVTPEVVIDEPVPAAPLPQTSGLDPGFLYGFGALLAGSGLVLRKRKVN